MTEAGEWAILTVASTERESIEALRFTLAFIEGSLPMEGRFN